MKYYTYAYLREDKTPYYIGKGKGNRAHKRSKTDIKPPKDKSRILILKNNLTEEEAFRHEVYMIAVFGRKDLGTGILYNKTDGGDGISGFVRNDEWKRKQSEVRKGKNHPNYGKTLSEEHKEKISQSNKGKTCSEEHKKKISEAKKNISEETRKKMSEAKIGKTPSEETRRKLSKAGKNRIHSEETKKKLSELKIGKKWWNDGFGNTKFSLKCPDTGWVLGRK